MSSLVVVLDACVLVPASLRDILLRAADADLYRLQWTDNILEEVERNLIGKIGLRKEQANDLRNPPRSVLELLATLAQHAPKFVWLVREKIDNSQY